MILEKVPYYVYAGLPERSQRNIRCGIEASNIDYIGKKVTTYFDVELKDILSDSRKRQFVIPRQIIAYLAYRTQRYSLKSIGKWLKRDHSSIIYCRESVEDLMSIDKKYKKMIEEIEATIYEKI